MAQPIVIKALITIRVQPLLYLDLSGLQQSVLPLEVSVLQQPVLPLDVPLLLQSMLYLGTSVSVSVLSPEVSVLQQLVLHLDVSVQQQPVLCQKMAYSSLWCTWTVCLQEPVLHRDMSAYRSFCVHLRCMSTSYCKACAALIRVRL
jgi:hypothetical protein